MVDVAPAIGEQIVQLTSALPIPESRRPAVHGRGICLGLSSPPAGITVQTLSDAALPLLSLLVDVFRKAGDSLGVPAFTSVQVNLDSQSDLHRDANNLGPSLLYVCGDFTGGEFELLPRPPVYVGNNNGI